MESKWRAIVGCPDYEISECGRVRRLTHGEGRYPIGYELTAKRHQRGYHVYTLSGGTFLAHRLVALTWIGPAPTPKHEVAHNDGSRTNNHWRNLRWATPAQNQADRKLHGTYVHGQNAYSAKLTDEAADEIRQAYAVHGRRYSGGAVTMQTLADTYGLSITQVSRIVNAKQRAIHL